MDQNPKPLIPLIGTEDASDLQSPNETSNLYTTNFLKYLFSFICLVIPLLYWPAAFDAAGIPREGLIALSAGVALILFGLTQKTAQPISWHPVQLSILALLVWAAISYTWSVDRSSSILSLTQLTALIILYFAASRLSVKSIFEYIIPITLLAASIAALFAIGQNFGFNPLLFRMSSSSPSSTFINPNYASNFFDLMTPVALFFLLLQKPNRLEQKILACVALTTTLSCLVICHSRGSWLGLFIWATILIIFLVSKKNIRQMLIQPIKSNSIYLSIALTCTLIISILPSQTTSSEKINSLLSMSADASVETRIHAYENSLAGIIQNPLTGVGYGAFIMGFSPIVASYQPINFITKNQTLRYLHSDPLQIFFELGIPGGVLSLFIFFLVITMASRIVKSDKDPRIRIFVLGLLLALIASGSHSIFDFPLHLPTSAFFFWLWAGIITGLYIQLLPSRSVKPARIILISSALAGVIFSLFSLKLYTGYLGANRDIFIAIQNALHGKCETVYKYSNKAMNSFGLDHLTRFWYAKVYTYCNAPADEKLKAMNRIIALDPNMPLPYLTRGQLEFNSGDLVKASNDFNIFRKFLPYEPDGYLGLAHIAMKLNDKDHAQYWVEQALKHAPNDKKTQDLAKKLGFN